MSSNFGKNIQVQIFGQSHGEAIGVSIDGLPAGFVIDFERVQRFLNRRAPGNSPLSTPRKESDIPKILSGIIENTTCGSPVCAIFENSNTHSADYGNLKNTPRPAHADYTAFVKYGGKADMRGGGHFSGRLTAPLCFAGAICAQILQARGIFIGSHIAEIGGIRDVGYDGAALTRQQLCTPGQKEFSVIDDTQGALMRQEILTAKEEGDSVSGKVECAIIGLPAGLGDPMFDGVESRLAAALFAIPAVKAVEFGDTQARGSQNNDEFCIENDIIKTKTNHAGGILGGITSGMPVVFSVSFKPTPSIAQPQQTVNLETRQNVTIEIAGRHDPCIVPRALPCVEAAAAIVMLDMLERN